MRHLADIHFVLLPCCHSFAVGARLRCCCKQLLDVLCEIICGSTCNRDADGSIQALPGDQQLCTPLLNIGDQPIRKVQEVELHDDSGDYEDTCDELGDFTFQSNRLTGDIFFQGELCAVTSRNLLLHATTRQFLTLRGEMAGIAHKTWQVWRILRLSKSASSVCRGKR